MKNNLPLEFKSIVYLCKVYDKDSVDPLSYDQGLYPVLNRTC